LFVVEVRAQPRGEAWVCDVIVITDGEQSRYTLTVRGADLARWGGGAGAAGAEDLVARSFAFLLEREPPSSILRTFDLSVISRYFPEYDQEIRRPAP
jgi:hypothetical protein